jgi:peptidoglycan/LPS O-acetylase OafA/YrhL
LERQRTFRQLHAGQSGCHRILHDYRFPVLVEGNQGNRSHERIGPLRFKNLAALSDDRVSSHSLFGYHRLANPRISGAISQVATEIGQWLIGGFFGYPVINGAEPSYYNRITWSLQYEVWFYLVLPMLAFVFWRFWMFVLMAFSVLLIALFMHLHDLVGFILGGGAAYALARWPVPSTTPRSLSVVAALNLIGLCTVGLYLPPVSWRFIAFPIFLAVLYGCNFFGVLKTIAWRFLGTISYSVYLLHGTVLYIGLGLLNRFIPVAALSTVQMFAAFSVCAVIVVIVSASTYRFIEHPLMELGHRERTALRIKQTGVDTRVTQP